MCDCMCEHIMCMCFAYHNTLSHDFLPFSGRVRYTMSKHIQCIYMYVSTAVTCTNCMHVHFNQTHPTHRGSYMHTYIVHIYNIVLYIMYLYLPQLELTEGPITCSQISLYQTIGSTLTCMIRGMPLIST